MNLLITSFFGFCAPTIALLQERHDKGVQRIAEDLRSESIEKRDGASRNLKELGSPALPHLRELLSDRDAEVVERARWLIAVIEVQQQLTPALRKVANGIEERLAGGTKHSWTVAYLEFCAEKDGGLAFPTLTREDLDALIRPAFEGAATPWEKASLCELSARRGIRKAGPSIEKLLADPNPRVRASSVEALAKLAIKDALPTIRKLLCDVKEVRDQAAHALVLLQDEHAGRALTQLLAGSTGEESYSSIARALERLDRRTVCADLRAQLANEDPAVRRRMLWALADLRCPDSGASVLRALEDQIPETRAAAATAAARLGIREAGPRLVSLMSDRNPSVRASASSALGSLRLTEAILLLISRLGDNDAAVRQSAARALGEIGAKEAIPQLKGLLSDSDPLVRSVACIASARVGGKESVCQLKPLLKDSSELVRAAAARAISEAGGADDPSWVVELLTDPDQWVRIEAVRALGMLGDPGRAGALLRVMADPASTRGDRLATTYWLCSMKAARAVPTLLAESKDSWCLNAFAEPGIWRRLSENHLRGRIDGSLKEVIEQVAQSAGLRVVWELPSSEDTEFRLSEPRSLANHEGDLAAAVAMQWLLYSRFGGILEEGRIRVVTREEAARHWRAWWEMYQKE